jgi:hydrogenase maturation protein HypF
MNNKALSLEISGTVQGVGFRPFLYNLALEQNLRGEVKNNTNGVSAYLEGEESNLKQFLRLLIQKHPPKAQIEHLLENWVDPRGIKKLSILKSETNHTSIISTPPDLATCKKCFKEFSDSTNHRFNYPLISCTDCGPRYSVIQKLPFDREFTSYKDFPLCNKCQKEYQNPQDKRHHAQTIGCTHCGPNIFYWPKNFDISKFLLSGKILGLKGIGGFQLICSGEDTKVIQKLRERKNRPHRPLAVMAKNLKFIKNICEMSLEEEELLTSSTSPIVILKVKKNILPKNISPDTDTIGFFLPTTPLHQMLFEKLDFLIVTSANNRGAPIALGPEEIAPLVDGIISHDRKILSRCDDSVFLGTNLIRPGRGISPLIFSHQKKIDTPILSLGADLKNTICISRGNKSYLSPHIGDLYNYPTYKDFKKQIENFCSLLNVDPEIIAVDLHPNYFSSNYGREIAKERGVKLVEVGHHHAHALAVMEEHHIEKAYALTFDGTGFGPDGTLWGGELLHVYPGGYKRVSSLKPFLLPGGEKAIKDPKRQLMARYHEMGMEIGDDLLKQVLDKKINTPWTSSVGRLFDQVSALLDIQTDPVTYEGQAAIRLESMANKTSDSTLKGFNFKTIFEKDFKLIDTQNLIREILFEKENGAPIPMLAYRFHYTMTEIALAMLENFNDLPVIFCGGVFQNQLFSSMLLQRLKKRGLKAEIFPTNDAGISFGQTVYCRNNHA